ncbi:MAG TPA: hypothetical protein VFC42_10590 [Methylomirabilota bacterium]|jgi:hypothetical protein|nr:hypothetical protein [Methylomirabilota bacterium]
MAGVPYRGFTIVTGARRLESGGWAPEVVVQWVEFGTPRSRPVEAQRPAVFDTPEAAETRALQLGQRWVDQIH